MGADRCQTRNTTEPLLTFGLEHELDPKLLAIFIEPCPVSALSPVDFSCLQLETARLVRLRGHDEVLEVLVGRLVHLLLERGHKSYSWLDSGRDLVVL